MQERPWRSPLIDFLEPLTTDQLLKSLQQSERKSAEEISRAAIAFFIRAFSAAAQGMSKADLLHEALWARWVRPRGRRGPRLSSYRLMTADRYERRVALYRESGLGDRASRRRALDDEKAGRWLPDDWAVERAFIRQRQAIARTLQDRGETLPAELATVLSYGELPDTPPDPTEHPELCAETIGDKDGSGDDRIRKRIRESRKFLKGRRTLWKSSPK